jgi:hypothetical protein
VSEAPPTRRVPWRRAAGALAWLAALAMLALAGRLLWFGWHLVAAWDLQIGAVLAVQALALATLAGACLLSLLRGWRLSRAARRASGKPDGRNEFGGWPGFRERRGNLTVRCGQTSLRFWVLPAGLITSAAALEWLGDAKFSPAELLLGLVPVTMLALLAAAWGPSGWELVVDGARQNALLQRFGPFRRVREFTASLPTVQAVRLADDPRGRAVLTLQLTKGLDWLLELPGDWPPELRQAMVERLAQLAGVEGPPSGGPAQTRRDREQPGSVIRQGEGLP